VCRGIALVAACRIAVSKEMAVCSRSTVERKMGFKGMGLSRVDFKSCQFACL
jgi:hypothetical protein